MRFTHAQWAKINAADGDKDSFNAGSEPDISYGYRSFELLWYSSQDAKALHRADLNTLLRGAQFPNHPSKGPADSLSNSLAFFLRASFFKKFHDETWPIR